MIPFSINKSLVFCMILFLCVLLMFLGYQSIPVADDFCNKISIENFSVIEGLISSYQKWTGRLITTSVVLTLSKYLSLDNFNVISSFFGVLLVFLCLIATKIIAEVSPLSQKGLTLTLLLFAIFWFGFDKINAEIIFWATGGIVYLIPYAIFAYYLLYFQRKLSIAKKANFNKEYLLYFLSFCVGNLIETLNPIAVGFLVIHFIFSFRTASLAEKKMKALCLLFLLLGSLVLVLAPGNFARASLGTGSWKVFTIADLKESFYFIMKTTWGYHKQTFLYIFASAFLYYALYFKPRFDKKSFLFGFALLIASLLSLTPLFFVRDFIGPRQTSALLVFFAIGLFKIVDSLPGPSLNQNRIQWCFQIVRTLGVVILFLAICFSIYGEIELAIPMRKWFVETRTVDLRSTTKTSELVFTPYELTLPKRLHFNDITEQADHWINICLRDFYRVKSIRLDK